MNRKPVDYAAWAVDTMMRKFAAPDLPPKGRFHYHQGVFLSGVYQTYLMTGDEKYFRYVKDWVDSIIDENGAVTHFDEGQLDDIQPGILLYPLYRKTRDERYKKALDTLCPIIYNFRRNNAGGFWHKSDRPYQMWLDGLYMGGPIIAEYAKAFDHPEYFDLCAQQVLLMEEKTRDAKTGLLYHVWDESCQVPVCDKVTGLSPEFWGRSIGWVPVAILDDVEFFPDTHPKKEEMINVVRRLMKAIVPFQSEDGRWYQVVNKPDGEGNWLENSCSCLFAAAMCRGAVRGYLDKGILENAERAYRGVINSLTFEGDDLLIGNVCIGTGVGDYTHYINRPVSVNDLHGVGAFLLMCAEAQRAGIQ